mmetsp:Transcript_7773/g.10722  ORF Transcript_7773/g.10722 Transcript_7773/m.10722 type:complete len:509 (-) Transcript_7773:177-1703(-)
MLNHKISGASEPYHRLEAKMKKLQSDESLKKSDKGHDNNNREDSAFAETKFEASDMEPSIEESEEEVEEEDAEKALEISVDLLKNTPLLWATYKGHLRIIWLLLHDGYSPNDTDNMGNNALHLAAVSGDVKILKILIDDGASATVVNTYKNLAVDMATNKEARDILTAAMEATASMTEQDIIAKHEKNMKQYKKIVNNLAVAVQDAFKVANVMVLQSMSSNQTNKLSSALHDAIAVGKEWGLDEEIIEEGERILVKLDVAQDLIRDISSVKKASPMRSQEVYIATVFSLESSIRKAEEAGIESSQLQEAGELIKRCQCEYWLSVLLQRLQDVKVADDSNEHDMNKLRAALEKAENMLADEVIVDEASKFLRRLDSELGMSRAIAAMPVVKLPMENPPEGYWTERDVGKIEETEGYPAPPADSNGEYKWIPAEAFVALAAGIERLSASYVGSDLLGVNPAVIQQAKETITKAEKELKILEAKDHADKAAAVEVAKKMLKKLKKGSGKKK